MLACLNSSSTDLLQVFAGLPIFLLPCGFHSRACLVVSDFGFHKVWPIQFHLRLAISSGTHSCLVRAQSSPAVADSFWPVYLQDLSQTFIMKVCSHSWSHMLYFWRNWSVIIWENEKYSENMSHAVKCFHSFFELTQTSKSFSITHYQITKLLRALSLVDSCI